MQPRYFEKAEEQVSRRDRLAAEIAIVAFGIVVGIAATWALGWLFGKV